MQQIGRDHLQYCPNCRAVYREQEGHICEPMPTPKSDADTGGEGAALELEAAERVGRYLSSLENQLKAAESRIAELERQVRVLIECAKHYANRDRWDPMYPRHYESAEHDTGYDVAQSALAEAEEPKV